MGFWDGFINYYQMGGDYYDRDVISNATGAYGNNVVGQTSNLNKALDPKTYVIDEGPVTTNVSNPIVFALDVTGSMGVWPKVASISFRLSMTRCRCSMARS